MNTKGNIMSTSQYPTRLREVADLLEARPEYQNVVAIVAPSFLTLDVRSTPNQDAVIQSLMGDLGGKWRAHCALTSTDVRYESEKPARLGYQLVDILATDRAEVVAA